MKTKLTQRKGLMLIELIVSITILTLVILVVYSLFNVGNFSFEMSKNIGFAQQDSRFYVDYINSEIRNAKNVFLEYPSEDDQMGVSIYSLHLNDSNELIKTIYESEGENESIIGSGIEDIVFIPIITNNDEGIIFAESKTIRLYVNAIERHGNSEYNKSYNRLIRFENGDNREVIKYTYDETGSLIISDEPITKLYYTKYN